jgi:hypothetical protein
MSRSAPSAGPRIRHAPAALALVVTALAATPAHGGLLETSDPTASIRFAADVPRPEVLDEGLDDFSLLFWLRLPDDEPDTSRIITAGDAFTIGLGSDRTVVMRFDGKPDALKVALALDDLPADGAWLLVGCTIDTYNGRLDGWVRSDGGLAHASDGVVAPTGHAGWDGGRGWPITLGAAEGAPAFAGHLGLLVIRDHAIDADDVEHIWRDGEPHYFTPAMGTSGNLTGYGGIVWMTGHGVATDPRSGVNADADRGEIDGRIDANNVLVYSAADGDVANYFNAGLVDEVVGDWTFRSPHDPQRPWSGFFERELPDLVLPEPAYVAQPSPWRDGSPRTTRPASSGSSPRPTAAPPGRTTRTTRWRTGRTAASTWPGTSRSRA